MRANDDQQQLVQRLGVIGGSFDPIHIAHLIMAETVRETLQLDKVLFMPAGKQPLKQGIPVTSAEHRAAMVELAIRDNPYFDLSRVDLDREGLSYTADSIEKLREEWGSPDALAMWFIIGGDSLVTLPKWREPERIIANIRLAVIRRPNFSGDMDELEKLIPGVKAAIDWVPAPMLEISSTEIRERVHAGRSILYRTTDSVREYIETHDLYKKAGKKKE